MPAAGGITLGILAGGQATRLGGQDKAWIQRGGQPQVLRIAGRFTSDCCAVLVSANRDLHRYPTRGLLAVPDRQPGLGPIAGLDALAAACATPWLFTLPVDLVNDDARLLTALAQAAGQGAVACDDDGLQPLVALYRVETLRAALATSIAAGQYSVQRLQAALGLKQVALAGLRLGNLNTPADLAAAGCTILPE
ncbi:molybdenum cofactor guanylyltransferase [Thermomonas paludicola]|uniref:molybdenum cofactor guanylyltransferase n=1 Tax=Thermomonas paludicola TaxID=2884874 RepID=UPI0021145F12|nr:molybdenum cofactor guanylyltransferase [Thermomonas paludicola]